MKEALYYSTNEDKSVICRLCPHFCNIKPKKRGICKIRYNKDGVLISEVYGLVSSFHFDPVEKKPLYHFYPGSVIFSIGTIGCNMQCKFCQNCDISQADTDNFPALRPYFPDDLVKMALKEPTNIGIAYTYNEPSIWYEFMLDIARQARSVNLKNVMVTNGFINPEPLDELLNYMDAFNVDLKAFNDQFYKKYTSSRLEPVKEALKQIKSKDKHLEITNLVIPTLNDDETEFEQMVTWIADSLGKDTVFHISRYYPHYQITIKETLPELLLKFFHIAKKHLDYVYIGNIALNDGHNTYCNKCGKEVINRVGYYTYVSGIDVRGHCVYCGNSILRYFRNVSSKS